MDEPFGALDPVTRAELQREFRGIQQRVGKTVVIVTHDMLEALALADRVAVLDNGVLIACETPENIADSTHPDVRRLLDAVSLPCARDSPGATDACPDSCASGCRIVPSSPA